MVISGGITGRIITAHKYRWLHTLRSFIKMRNNRGPSTDSCGTVRLVGRLSDTIGIRTESNLISMS